MIVRCGRCRSELEIPGPGEFVCPACGTRNVARGGAAAAAAPPYSIGGAPSPGLTVPGGGPAPSLPPTPEVEPNWALCPACGYRFAVGEVTHLTCPNCRVELDRSPDGALSVSSG